MILYLDEFAMENATNAATLVRFQNDEEMIHKLPKENLLDYIAGYGARGYYGRRNAVSKYLKWLYNNHPEVIVPEDEIVEKIYAIQHENDISNNYIGFYDADDIISFTNQMISDIENDSEGKKRVTDTDKIRAVVYLLWCNFSEHEILDISLSDVSEDGKTIYNKARNMKFEIADSRMADFFADYKFSTGFDKYGNHDLVPYIGKTFVRSTNAELNKKSISNIKCKILKQTKDERLKDRRILYSGRYNQMYNYEIHNNEIISMSSMFGVHPNHNQNEFMKALWNQPFIKSTFYTIMKDYNVYRDEYMKYLGRN